MDSNVMHAVGEIAGRAYGKHRGFVVDNEDPSKLARVKLRVPSVLGDEVSSWALPCLPFGGVSGHGFFAVPEVGAQVWVEFEAGDPSKPIWTGTFWQAEGDPPPEADRAPPTNRVLRSVSGHVLELDDEEGEERVRLAHKAGAELAIDEHGSVTVTSADGAAVTLDAEGSELVVEDANGNRLVMSSSGTTLEDANGNKVTMAASGVSVEGTKVVVKGSQVVVGGDAGEPLLKGQAFLTLFMTHVHPTAMGPSGPPVPTGTEANALSLKSMTG